MYSQATRRDIELALYRGVKVILLKLPDFIEEKGFWIFVGACLFLLLVKYLLEPERTVQQFKESLEKSKERRRKHSEAIDFRIDPRPRQCRSCGVIVSASKWNRKGGCPNCGSDYATLVDDPSFPEG
jgi:predicted Zn-ribbon and HTH transcriptional regulator